MSAPLHSPAPWRVSWGLIRDADGAVVADLGAHRMAEMDYGRDARLAADARLLSAAPGLLAVLKLALEDHPDWRVAATALVGAVDGQPS